MRIVIFIILVVASLSLPEAPAQATNSLGGKARDALYLRNGDLLHGKLAGVDSTNGISWTRGDAVNVFSFAPAHVMEIVLGGASLSRQAGSSNYCNVQLKNGDMLGGELVAYDGKTLSIDTAYAGKITLPKETVAMLLPVGVPKPVLFEGPNGLGGWTHGKVNAAGVMESGEWVYQNGAFYAVKSASIARDVGLPDSSSLSFDLEWRGFFHVAVALYTEYLHPINLANKETEPNFGGFYSLQINPFSANLLPVKQTEALRYMGQTPLQHLAQKTSAHFDIRVSKEKRTVALLIDGTLVKQWSDSDTFAGTGKAVRFVHQGQGAVKLSNIKITEWDGQFEEPPTITPNKSSDLTRLKNGDRIAGAVRSIEEGKMKVEGAGTLLEIPMTRVKQTEFYSEKQVPSKRNATTVRAYFPSGGSVTFELEEWSEKGIAANSANFGKLQFRPGTFSRVLFDVDGAPAMR